MIYEIQGNLNKTSRLVNISMSSCTTRECKTNISRVTVLLKQVSSDIIAFIVLLATRVIVLVSSIVCSIL